MVASQREHPLADAAARRGHGPTRGRAARPGAAAGRGAAGAARARRAAIRSTRRSTCGCCRTAACSRAASGGWALEERSMACRSRCRASSPPAWTRSAARRSAVQDAAVVGRTAWLGAVCALSSPTVGAGRRSAVPLERKQLVLRVRRPSIRGETEFRFAHALTLEVAYSQIRRVDRAHKHESAAAWIARFGGGPRGQGRAAGAPLRHGTRSAQAARRGAGAADEEGGHRTRRGGPPVGGPKRARTRRRIFRLRTVGAAGERSPASERAGRAGSRAHTGRGRRRRGAAGSAGGAGRRRALGGRGPDRGAARPPGD